MGVFESPRRNTRRKCKRTADLNTDSEDDDENSITKCSTRSRNKPSHRRVNSSDSDDDVPKKSRVASGAAHTPSSNEGDSDNAVFNPTDSKKSETPTRLGRWSNKSCVWKLVFPYMPTMKCVESALALDKVCCA